MVGGWRARRATVVLDLKANSHSAVKSLLLTLFLGPLDQFNNIYLAIYLFIYKKVKVSLTKLYPKNPMSISHTFCDTSGETGTNIHAPKVGNWRQNKITKPQKSNVVSQWIYWDYLQEHGQPTAAASPKAHSSMAMRHGSWNPGALCTARRKLGRSESLLQAS